MPKENTIRSASQAISVLASAAVDEIRNETLSGKEYTVVPVVALLEGVWHGASSEHPELALASEFGSVPEGWNGRPVTLGHPKRAGSFVSAGSPDVYEKDTIGMLFNTTCKDKKLKTEAWIDKAKVEELGEDIQKEVNRLTSGELVEVSTGLFTNMEDTEGVFNGQEFVGIWRNVIPDHLAILPEGVIGACSVADGAGAPRVNQMRTLSKRVNSNDKSNGNLGARTLQHLCDKYQGAMQFKGLSSLSNSDTQIAIELALALADKENYYYLVAVFKDSFVYIRNWESIFYQRGYAISNTGAVTLGTSVTAVRPVTEFVPIEVNIEGETTMTVQEKVAALLSKAGSKFNESDKEWLEKLNEEQIDRLSEATEGTKPAEGNTEGATEAETAGASEGATEAGEGSAATTETSEEGAAPETLESYLAKAPTEIREVLNEGIQLQRAQKDALVKSIRANKQCEFPEEELKAKNMKELERLAKLAKVPNYAGNSGAAAPTVNEGVDESFVAAPEVFGKKSAGSK